MANEKALALPDALLVRYFRSGEIEFITSVASLSSARLKITLKIGGDRRIDYWRDLGGGLGFVPEEPGE